MTACNTTKWSNALNGADVEFVNNHVMVIGNNHCQNSNLLNEQTVFDLFKQYGAILFRNFKISYPEFNAISNQHCSSFLSQAAGNRKIMQDDPTTQTVNQGNDAFPYHPELSQFPWQPDIAWFCCAKTPENKNEGTILCDGIELAKILEQKDREQLMNNQLRYSMRLPRDTLSKILEIDLPENDKIQSYNDSTLFTFEIKNGELWNYYTCDCLSTPLFSKELAFNNFMIFSRLYNHLNNFPTFNNDDLIPDELINRISERADTIATQMDWQQGDLLMINNTRFMHARPAIIDPEKRTILTRFGYAKRHPEREQLSQCCPWRRDGVTFSQVDGII